MRKLSTLFILMMMVSFALSQEAGDNAIPGGTEKDRALQYFRQPGYAGLNVFETSTDTDIEYDGFEVRVGGDFALQFQGLSHSNASGAPQLVELGNNIMDAFTTEPFLEVTLQPKDLIIVGGVSNGLLNPTVSKALTAWGSGAYQGTADWKPTYYGKLGFDKQVNNSMRVSQDYFFYLIGLV